MAAVAAVQVQLGIPTAQVVVLAEVERVLEISVLAGLEIHQQRLHHKVIMVEMALERQLILREAEVEQELPVEMLLQ
jgi:hypothetical protein